MHACVCVHVCVCAHAFQPRKRKALKILNLSTLPFQNTVISPNRLLNFTNSDRKERRKKSRKKKQEEELVEEEEEEEEKDEEVQQTTLQPQENIAAVTDLKMGVWFPQEGVGIQNSLLCPYHLA